MGPPWSVSLLRHAEPPQAFGPAAVFCVFSGGGGRAVRIVPAAVLVLLTAQRVQRETAAAVAHPGESLDQAARAEESAPLHLGLDLVGPGLQLGAQFFQAQQLGGAVLNGSASKGAIVINP